MDDINSGKLLYQCRDVCLIQHDETYYICVGESRKVQAGSCNPITAWSCFVDILDSKVRRRIGDMLERQGKNRYTGEF